MKQKVSEQTVNPYANQAPEDKHGPGYENDVPSDSWLRSQGTKMPHFDKSNAWRGGKLRED